MKLGWRGAFAAAVMALLPAAAMAQAWPTKPVKIVVPFAAGGATDVVARLLAQKLTEAWGQSVIVEDRVGAGGNIGADVVAKSAPDGYTLLMHSGALVTNQFVYPNSPFDAIKDFAPITNVARGPQVIAVNVDLPVKNLKELIEYAKAKPRGINFGSAGIGSQTHLVAENLAYAAGVDFTHVPYKGESAALTDLMGGQIQLVAANLGGAVTLIQQNKVRALAVTSRERNPVLPDVPPASESLPGFESSGWFGLLAPAGTPKDIVEKVYRDTAKILQSDEFKAKLGQQGMAPVANTPAEFAGAIREESVRWGKIIKERGITAG